MTVLDTHTWVWWVDGDTRLSRAARAAIDGSEQIGDSPISAWELATLERLGRLAVRPDLRIWIRRALAYPNVTTCEITADIAAIAGSLLPPFPGDPADRIIYSTALAANAKLISADRRLARHDPARVVW